MIRRIVAAALGTIGLKNWQNIILKVDRIWTATGTYNWLCWVSCHNRQFMLTCDEKNRKRKDNHNNFFHQTVIYTKIILMFNEF
jgi:hypothetical protein